MNPIKGGAVADILIVDDDPKICLFLSKLLESMGHVCLVANSVKQAMDFSRGEWIDLVLLDLELSDGNGLRILPDLMKSPSEPEVIIITGTGNVQGAELAFKYGAWDYVQKPFLLDEVCLPITRALQYRREKQSSGRSVPFDRPHIVGESQALKNCLAEAARAAASDAGVLITGETGTGKELVARAIHANSPRGAKPFVVVDCGALPETLVESTLFGHEKGAFTGAEKKQEGLIVQAQGGTLMLDEVGDLPPAAQKSFLRTLQEKSVRPIGGKTETQVDFRLVAATHLDLDRLVTENRFRKDLLYRIRAIGIHLPPLRERKEDIESIVIKKIHELAQRYGRESKAVSTEFFKTLMSHPWPGNVRELVNVLEYAMASAGPDPTLFPKHLPPKYRIALLDFESPRQTNSSDKDAPLEDPPRHLPPLSDYRDRLEKDYLRQLMAQVQGDREKACRLSGISQSRLYALLKKHGLSGFSTFS